MFDQPHGSDPNSSWLKMRLDGSKTQAARLRCWSHGGTQSHASFSAVFVQSPTCGPADRVKNGPPRDNSGKKGEKKEEKEEKKKSPAEAAACVAAN